MLTALVISPPFIIPGCLFDTNQPAEPIVLSRVGAAGDTVSPIPAFRFTVSSPLSDSSVDFEFTPATAADYSAYLNPAKDTISLQLHEMLEGNTRYVIRLKSPLHSAGGATLLPGQDSIVFFTAACEHEPNHLFSLADTLYSSRIFGTMSMASDTDVYCVPTAPGYTLYLSSSGGRDTFMIFDSLFQPVSAESEGENPDTIVVPGTTLFPLYVKVFSYINGTAGAYEFGIIRK